MALPQEVDPFKTPLKINVRFIHPHSILGEKFGVFSTKFWCRPDESPVKVSYDLLYNSLSTQFQYELAGLNIYLDQWSGSELPIREENMLNTAIYEMLELGITTAKLIVK